jgi:hypothetical protein
MKEIRKLRVQLTSAGMFFHCLQRTYWFLAHQNWKLKWVFLIAHRPSILLFVCELAYFRLPLQNHWTNFIQTWHKAFLGGGDSSLVKGRGGNSKRVKLHWYFFKKFPEPAGPFQSSLILKSSMGRENSRLFK